MQLAKEILGGQYEFIFTTHIDKGHIHNHLIFNSVSFADYHHYHSNKRSYHYIRRVSDRLCKEHGLSVIIHGQNRGKSYAEYTTEKTGTSYKAKLKAAINKRIPISSNFENLICRLQNERYEIKRGKYMSCRDSGQERFTRMKTLGADYTEETVAARIAGRSRPSRQPKKDDKRINLLIDIQNNIKAQESTGFAHWAKINNLKQAVRTMNFLTEHGISSYEELEEKAAVTASASDKLLVSVKSKETHIADLSLLMKHATVYRKLKPIYDSYRKSSDKEKFLRGHESDIILFEASANVSVHPNSQAGNFCNTSDCSFYLGRLICAVCTKVGKTIGSIVDIAGSFVQPFISLDPLRLAYLCGFYCHCIGKLFPSGFIDNPHCSRQFISSGEMRNQPVNQFCYCGLSATTFSAK